MKSRNSEMTPKHTLRVLATLETQFQKLDASISVENDDGYPVIALLQSSFLQKSDFYPLFQLIRKRIPADQPKRKADDADVVNVRAKRQRRVQR